MDEAQALVKSTGTRICNLEKEATDKQRLTIEQTLMAKKEFKEWERVSPKLATIKQFVDECGGLADKMPLSDTDKLLVKLKEVFIY